MGVGGLSQVRMLSHSSHTGFVVIEWNSVLFGCVVRWCERTQHIDLLAHVPASVLLTCPCITVLTAYKGTGPDVRDFYEVNITLRSAPLTDSKSAPTSDSSSAPITATASALTSLSGGSGGAVLCTASSGLLRATAQWRTHSLTLSGYHCPPTLSTGAVPRFVTLTQRAKDSECWGGHYGTRLGPVQVIVQLPASAQHKDGKGESGGVSGFVSAPRQLPLSVPFCTSFCTVRPLHLYFVVHF
jgi:hypothetical protein